MIFLKILAYIVICLYLVAMLLILFYSMLHFHLLIKYLKNKNKRSQTTPSPIPDQALPTVTVQLPVYNEPMVINRLIDNIVRLDYPPGKLQIQILDDSTDETKIICAQKVAWYKARGIPIALIHRQDRAGYKAGALQNGLTTATGEYIAIFDADFLPQRDFLRLTIPFFSNENIGVVQTRWGHINEGFSIITRLQAFQLNVHFSIEQTGRQLGSYFLQFNGTAGIWRKAAIADAGGWKDDTLTEDLDLSYRAQLKGWKIYYRQEIVTPAELPVEMTGLRSQQFRWMKGGAENARRLLSDILSTKLPLSQKIHACAHLLSSSIFLIVFLLAVLSVPVLLLYPITDLNLKWLSLFFIPLLLLAWVYFVGNSDTSWKNESNLKRILRFLWMFPVFLSLSMGLSFHATRALIEGFSGKKSAFIRTPKFNIQPQQNQLTNITPRSPLRLSMLWAEGLIAIYFVGGVASAVFFRDYSFLTYHLMLVIGFGSIFILTLLHQFRA